MAQADTTVRVVNSEIQSSRLAGQLERVGESMRPELQYILRKFNLDPAADYSRMQMPIGIRTNRRELGLLTHELGYTKGAEIGTARGVYAQVLCKANPRMELWCVDPWEAYHGYKDYQKQSTLNDLYTEAQERLKDCRVAFVKAYSVEASNTFPNALFDFVYIDANHSFEYVVADIAAWLPKVRPGGIIAGHDFAHPKGKGFGVIEAVEGWTKAYHVAPWFIMKGEHERDGDRCHSWMWVKE